MRRARTALLALLLCAFLPLSAAPLAAGEGGKEPEEKEAHAEHGEKTDEHGKHGKHSSRLPDEAIPLQLEGFPERPKPLLELGEPFLGTGTLDPGFRLPTGAVWQPSLLLFGTFRSALQTFDSDQLPPGAPAGASPRVTEWANRLDLFFNLQLSGSERLVVGVRALDQDGRFTSYFFESPLEDTPGFDDFQEELNADIESLFFEGDFGEIFPNLDRQDFGRTDVGFSVGRQPLFFQEGMLIQDTIDGIGITRNTLLPKKTSNFRMTFFYGWDNVNLSMSEERSADLFALLTSTDFRRSTVDLDVVYLAGEDDDPFGDLLVAGVSAVQRLGKTNSSFRVLSSFALDEETAASTDGTLLFSELSWVPHYTHDLLYVNTFVAFDAYTPAARGIGPTAGGPLGRAGINFASVGLGSYGAALSAEARDVAGATVGYQKFFAGNRRQLVVEAAARVGTRSLVADSYAGSVRYQAAFGRRVVVVLDGFVGRREGLFGGDDETLSGGRLELLVKF